jgi:hypothetical protein
MGGTDGQNEAKRYLQDFESGAENRDIRPGAVRSDDGAVPALGSQSVVVDVRIPAAMNWRKRATLRSDGRAGLEFVIPA